MNQPVYCEKSGPGGRTRHPCGDHHDVAPSRENGPGARKMLGRNPNQQATNSCFGNGGAAEAQDKFGLTMENAAWNLTASAKWKTQPMTTWDLFSEIPCSSSWMTPSLKLPRSAGKCFFWRLLESCMERSLFQQQYEWKKASSCT